LLPTPQPSEFSYIYLSIRARFRQLKIDNSYILDVHYPAHDVVALLVHKDFVPHLTAHQSNVNIELIANFVPPHLSTSDSRQCRA
ncbi:hypothetical protein BDB00DRAFT_754676, partial [Zychaea mexicana]|uniref:uncharacterized protein n=1 Tax=Zychaea mexicana TaxID=64656 RepID=UPI0022FEB266